MIGKFLVDSDRISGLAVHEDKIEINSFWKSDIDLPCKVLLGRHNTNYRSE
jgi:hypothetical protein